MCKNLDKAAARFQYALPSRPYHRKRRDHGMLRKMWSRLTKIKLFQNEVLGEIGSKYGKTISCNNKKTAPLHQRAGFLR